MTTTELVVVIITFLYYLLIASLSSIFALHYSKRNKLTPLYQSVTQYCLQPAIIIHGLHQAATVSFLYYLYQHSHIEYFIIILILFVVHRLTSSILTCWEQNNFAIGLLHFVFDFQFCQTTYLKFFISTSFHEQRIIFLEVWCLGSANVFVSILCLFYNDHFILWFILFSAILLIIYDSLTNYMLHDSLSLLIGQLMDVIAQIFLLILLYTTVHFIAFIIVICLKFAFFIGIKCYLDINYDFNFMFAVLSVYYMPLYKYCFIEENERVVVHVIVTVFNFICLIIITIFIFTVNNILLQQIYSSILILFIFSFIFTFISSYLFCSKYFIQTINGLAGFPLRREKPQYTRQHKNEFLDEWDLSRLEKRFFMNDYSLIENYYDFVATKSLWDAKYKYKKHQNILFVGDYSNDSAQQFEPKCCEAFKVLSNSNYRNYYDKVPYDMTDKINKMYLIIGFINKEMNKHFNIPLEIKQIICYYYSYSEFCINNYKMQNFTLLDRKYEFQLFHICNLDVINKVLYNCNEMINIIVYCVSLSEYNQYDKNGINLITKSVNRFKNLLNKFYTDFTKIPNETIVPPVLLLLFDSVLFKDKISTSPISDHFNDFKGDIKDTQQSIEYITLQYTDSVRHYRSCDIEVQYPDYNSKLSKFQEWINDIRRKRSPRWMW
eukprot:285423_1